MQTRSLLVLGLALASCAVPGSPADQQAADIAEYNELQQQLDGARSKFLGDQAGETISDGERLFWLDHSAFAPVLHSYDERTDTQLTYKFPIGSGDDANFVVSGTAIATAVRIGETVRYSTYDVTQPDRLLGAVELTAPDDGQKWWAYALDGTQLYVVTTGVVTTLVRSVAGATPSTVTTLESAGCAVGELWNFTIQGQRMTVIESGRIWSLDLGTNTAVWLGNETEATAAIADADGVVFETAAGPFFYRNATAELIDLGAAIARAPYQLNETFRSAHLYYADLARHGTWFIYIANSGVFAYDLKRERVVPLLLSPRGDLRIDYRYPTPTNRGSLFVTGLESNTGAVGADGPIHRVDLTRALL